MFGKIGPWELLIILGIVLIIIGPGKLPQVGESLGKALQNFRKTQNTQFDDEEPRKDK